MKITNFLSKKKADKASLSIVLLKDAMYFCQEKDAQIVDSFPIQDNQWQSALVSALDDHSIKDICVTVTLGSHHYQSYQIDKPVIPEEEWPEALPFLVKDLISERVNDVAVSGVLLPHASKVQAYVMKKSLLTELNEVFEPRKITMLQVIPEDSVWGATRTSDPNFMLLNSTQNTEFKMGAFVDGVSIFQRTIRGMRSPITGASKDEFQLDTLALEIQRSMDFLSSQLKQTQINRLFLCSDSDDLEELSTELKNRVNVKVESLTPSDKKTLCGNVLARAALALELQKSNFYSPYLQPKKDPFDLKIIMILWLITAGLLVAVYLFFYIQSTMSASETKSLQQESQQLDKTIQEMQQRLAQNIPSEKKKQEIEQLKAHIQTQEKALDAVDNFDDRELRGYSGIMDSLSMLAGNDISVTGIQMNYQQMNLQGYARSPQSVPKWVNQFKSEDGLKDRLFKGMSITNDEDDNIIFSLHSTVVEANNE